MKGSHPLLRLMLGGVLVVGGVAGQSSSRGASAQEAYQSGQNVVPVYEGWEPNPDGSFNLVFGYFNRNWEEEIDLPVGPNNMIEPGGADQGQPTHFSPRRNRFLFKIRVPKDFGNKELVWTLTSNGKTDRAYGTLKPDYFIDDVVIMNNNGAGGSGGGGFNINGNKPPVLKVEGEKQQTVKVGEPITMNALVTDDGIPKRRIARSTPAAAASAANAAAVPRTASTPAALPYTPARIGSRCCPDSSSGLRLGWFVYRGPAANVTFDPPQFEVWEDYRDGRNSPYSEGWEPPPVPADGKYTVRTTFTAPGTYVIRAQAHDGGLLTTEDMTFVVK
jgi:hypothetical protein